MFGFRNKVVLVKDYKHELTHSIHGNSPFCLLCIQFVAGKILIRDPGISFSLGDIRFGDTRLATLDGLSFKEKKILELLKANKLNGDGGSGQTPKLMSLMIKLFPNTLRYVVSINKKFNQSLQAVSLYASFKINGCVKLEEHIEGEWVQWDSREDILLAFSREVRYVNREASAANMDSYTIYSSTSADFEAIQLILRKKKELRIRINLDISFQWESREQLLPPLKLDVGKIIDKIGEQVDPKEVATITVEGTIVATCLKKLLAGKSKVCDRMLKSGMKESESGNIYLFGISKHIAQLIINCVMGVEISPSELDCEDISDLFEAAHQYDIPDLESYCVSFMLYQDDEWYTGNTILKIYFFLECLERFQPLQNHLLSVMFRMKSAGLESCDAFQVLHSTIQEDLLRKMDENQ